MGKSRAASSVERMDGDLGFESETVEHAGCTVNLASGSGDVQDWTAARDCG